MIEIKVRFWTNDIADESGHVLPKHAWASGVVRIEPNALHGIKPGKPRPFHSLMDLSAMIEKVLIQHEIVLHAGRQSTATVRQTVGACELLSSRRITPSRGASSRQKPKFPCAVIPQHAGDHEEFKLVRRFLGVAGQDRATSAREGILITMDCQGQSEYTPGELRRLPQRVGTTRVLWIDRG